MGSSSDLVEVKKKVKQLYCHDGHTRQNQKARSDGSVGAKQNQLFYPVCINVQVHLLSAENKFPTHIHLHLLYNSAAFLFLCIAII